MGSDKRPYEFREADKDGSNVSVKRKIPDATIGLRAYSELDIETGFRCELKDCKDDHSALAPHPALAKEDILEMMNEPECGLVVDGIWGKADIIFPWAVYEAKKRAISYDQSEAQIYHALRVYMGILDDLARDPNYVGRYQTPNSDQYQIFGFTSNGPAWGVYVAWKFLGGCVSFLNMSPAELFLT